MGNKPPEDDRSDLLQGTLDLLLLKILALEPMHGWGISERLEQTSGEVFRLNPGSLYPALQRLLRRGWIVAEWRTTANNRRARYYRLTAAGHRRLGDEEASWRRASAAVDRVLATEPVGVG